MLQFLSRAVELVPEVKAHLSDKAFEVLKSIDTYDRQLWKYALDLYRGGDPGVFITSFVEAIGNQLTRAFREGAKTAGFNPDDFTEQDNEFLQSIINNQYEYILDLAQAIEQSGINGDTLQDFRSAFRSRIETWVNRYNEVVNMAIQRFSTGRDKLKFVLGETEKHCHTGDTPGKIGCSELNGIVLYKSEWDQTGIQPGVADSPVLACGGWQCKCKFEPTTDNRTRSGLTRVLDMLVSANL
jgi:hypothetical protein